MRSDIYLFNHWGDCLLIVVAARPDFPNEVNEQAPQHQVDDHEGYGEPQGHIVEVIEEIHLHTKSSIFSLQIYAGQGQSAVLIRNLMSQFAILPVLIRKIRQYFNSR